MIAERYLDKYYVGDNLSVMDRLPDDCVDLIYLDPPFFTQSIRRGRAGTFEDRWASAKEYLLFIALRLKRLKSLLKPTGSIYLHCDPTMSHYLKIIMDKIFGRKSFRNEIVWCYKGSIPLVKYGYPRKHDILFLYCSKGSTFNPQFLPYSNSALDQYNKTDAEGRKYRKHSIRLNGTERRLYYDKAKGVTVLSWWSDIHSFGLLRNQKKEQDIQHRNLCSA